MAASVKYLFTADDYEIIRSIVHAEGFPGFRLGRTHLDLSSTRKYVTDFWLDGVASYSAPGVCVELLFKYLTQAHGLAIQVSDKLDLPAECKPSIEYSHIRLIDYPPGSGTTPHCDRSMFTINLYRNMDVVRSISGRHELADDYPGLMMGTMRRKIGLGEATKHEIPAADKSQHTILYFAIPDLSVWIPYAIERGATDMEFWNRRFESKHGRKY